jgi:hypothetical protein
MKSTSTPLPEMWRPIPFAPGYEARSLGRIRSATGPDLLSLVLNSKTGYLQFKASVDGRRMSCTAHRAVCAAFHGEPPAPRYHAAHGNGIKTDNRPENLRWATPSENVMDSIEHGTWNRVYQTRRNPRSHLTKLTEDQALEIMALQGKAGATEVGRCYGVSRGAVRSIWDGRSFSDLAPTGAMEATP